MNRFLSVPKLIEPLVVKLSEVKVSFDFNAWQVVTDQRAFAKRNSDELSKIANLSKIVEFVSARNITEVLSLKTRRFNELKV